MSRGCGALVVLTAAALVPAHGIVAQAAPRVTRIWMLGVNAEGGYESNVRQQPDGVSDRVARINGVALRTWTQPRGHLTLRGTGSLSRFRESRDLNQFTYGAGADMARAVTPRLGVSAGATFETRLSSEISATPGPGVTILPVSLSRGAGATAGLAYRMTPETDGALTASYYRVTFNTPALLPGATLNAQGTLSHRVATRSALALVGAVQEGTSQGLKLNTQTLTGGWTTTSASGQLGASVRAGATRALAGGPPKYSPSGEAALRARIKRGEATLHYSRAVSQAFGLGRLLASDAIGASYTRVAFYGLAVSGAVQHAWNGNPDSNAGRFQTTDGGVELRRVLSSGLTLGGGASYRMVQPGAGATQATTAVSGTSAHISIGYTLGGN